MRNKLFSLFNLFRWGRMFVNPLRFGKNLCRSYVCQKSLSCWNFGWCWQVQYWYWAEACHFFLFLSSFRITKVKSIWERKKKIMLLSFILIFQVSLWIYLLHVFVYQARHLLFYSCSSRWLSLQLGGIGWNSETCDLSNASTT